MPDKPPSILFPTMADRYPEPDDSDKTREGLKAVIETVPGGSLMSFALSRWLAPKLQERRDAWLKELADEISSLKEKVEGFSLETLANDEAFVTSTIRATRIAIDTHRVEKREMLKNALVNVAQGKATNEDQREAFFNAIEEFTPTHVQVLDILWRGQQKLMERGLTNPREPYRYTKIADIIEALLPPHPPRSREFLQSIMTDLRNRGLSNVGTAAGPMPHPAITNMGIEFLNFVNK